MEEQINMETKPKKNKGSCAGGSNTNYYGKKFEQKTSNELRLLNNGYSKLINRNFYCKEYYF